MAEIKNLQDGFYDLDKGTYLLLINPEKIPHLAYLQDGKYYSLTYTGVELGYSIAPYFEKLIRTQKKIIFLELDLYNGQPHKIFSNYLSAGVSSVTCFFPVKELLLPGSSAEMIHQLIPELYKNAIIKSAKHFGMTDLLDKNRSFQLSDYSKEDVFSYISQLRRKYVRRP